MFSSTAQWPVTKLICADVQSVEGGTQKSIGKEMNHCGEIISLLKEEVMRSLMVEKNIRKSMQVNTGRGMYPTLSVIEKLTLRQKQKVVFLKERI